MNISDFRFGFRCLDRQGDRKLTDARAAFVAHVKADPTAATPDECFLSHFQFADEFRERLEKTGSTKGYAGPTWAEWLVFDIDVEGDVLEALEQTRRLVSWLVSEFNLNHDNLMIFYSGSKGFHVGLPSCLWRGLPAVRFHEYVRRVFETLAADSKVHIDSAVYARVNLLRAPNSRHRKTRRYKIQLTFDELMNLAPDAILAIAAEPREGWIPEPVAENASAVEYWAEAIAAVEADQKQSKPLPFDDPEPKEPQPFAVRTKLNALTRAILQSGLITGDRHRELFSAAANMAEFSRDELIRALLTGPGLSSGIPAADVARQILCGIQHGGRSHGQ